MDNKIIIKKICALMLLFVFVKQINAQDDSFSILPTIGVTAPILDNGLGFYIGVNPSIRLTERLSAEGQLSYTYTRISSSFISGNVGTVNSLNTLVGIRFYINSEDKKTRIFFNVLTGLNYLQEKENSISKDSEFNLGFSGGVFIDLNRIVIGLTYDTPQNLILKLAYAL